MNGISIRLFGKFHIVVDDGAVAHFEAAKVQELLAFLLLYRDRAHSREVLADSLWNGNGGEQSRKYLRQALWQLQRGLDAAADAGLSELLLISGDWIAINPAVDVRVDVSQFEQACARAANVPGEALDDAAADVLRRAAELYHGDLLEACYQDWCLFERERLQNMYLLLLDKLMSHAEAHREFEDAVGYGTRILRLEHAHERTHRRLMRLYYLTGHRTAALRQYQRCVAALREQLDVEPARSTVVLHEQIRRDRLGEGEQTADAAPQGSRSAVSLSAVLLELERMRVALQQLRREIVGMPGGSDHR